MKVVKHHDAAKDAIKDQIIRSLFKKLPPRPRDLGIAGFLYTERQGGLSRITVT